MTTARKPHASGTPAQMTHFDDIYGRPDPRSYFATLGPLDYQAPHHAQRLFRRLLPFAGFPEDHARRAGRDGVPGATVLDICCSYGINAALLNYHVTLRELYDHYTSPQVAQLTTDELIKEDREFYAARRRTDAVPVIGLDISAPAIAYARSVGLLDDGFAENLETGPPSPALHQATRDTRLITVTGGATFLSALTYRALLKGRQEPPWVAALVLRTVPYKDTSDALTEFGLTTQKDTSRTYPQRRFTDADEQRYAIAAASAAGNDPRGKETDGHFHTALHLSRPPAHAAAHPLHTLLQDP